MSADQRPWWLLVNRPAGLITTVREESGADERVFIIRGEPMVQGLAWLTWGPIAALLVVLLLTGLAVGLDVRDEAGPIQAVFTAAFLGLPALAWGITTIIVTRLAAKHIQAEREASSQKCLIRLDQKRGELGYQTTALSTEEKQTYSAIRRVRVTPAIGARDRQALRLTLETDDGSIVLLNEELGTQAQKTDLAREIEAALRNYLEK